MPRTNATLETWLEQAVGAGNATLELTDIIRGLGSACAEVSRVLRTAALDGFSGAVSTSNVHGEAQKALDVRCNEVFVQKLSALEPVSVLISEEIEEPLAVHAGAPYGVSFDPLDGSSNSDVNMTVGSIFSIHAVDAAQPTMLKPGREQVGAGFAAYGPNTSLVLTFGDTVALFMLDPADETFYLQNPSLRVPLRSNEYAINASRHLLWDEVIRTYISDRVEGRGLMGREPANMRWTASMVADVQRILSRGGIFLYPADSKTAHVGGRLRLLYEAVPMAMLIEAAGGRATTGTDDLLDLVPASIHQKVPVIVGSKQDVEDIEHTYRWAKLSRRTRRRVTSGRPR